MKRSNVNLGDYLLKGGCLNGQNANYRQCSQWTKAKYIKRRHHTTAGPHEKAMTHTQHPEVNENVSRPMHPEYKTRETVGFTYTFKIHIFWLIECSNHSWLIFFSFFFFLSLFQSLLSYLADEIQSSLNTKVNNLVTWAYLFCLHCPVVIAEMEKYMCSFGDGCLLLTRCPVFVQLQVMLVCIKTFNLL